MKKLQPIICAGILVAAMSAPAFAKSGIISTTKTGIISTTKTGIISTTKTGIISTTKMETSSTTRITSKDSTSSWDRYPLVNLLFTAFGLW